MGDIGGEGREQGTLFPVVLDDLIPADPMCRVIDAFVDRLAMSELGFERSQDASAQTDLEEGQGHLLHSQQVHSQQGRLRRLRSEAALYPGSTTADDPIARRRRAQPHAHQSHAPGHETAALHRRASLRRAQVPYLRPSPTAAARHPRRGDRNRARHHGLQPATHLQPARRRNTHPKTQPCMTQNKNPPQRGALLQIKLTSSVTDSIAGPFLCYSSYNGRQWAFSLHCGTRIRSNSDSEIASARLT